MNIKHRIQYDVQAREWMCLCALFHYANEIQYTRLVRDSVSEEKSRKRYRLKRTPAAKKPCAELENDKFMIHTIASIEWP